MATHRTVHLLREADLASLRAPLEILRDHRDAILSTWYGKYVGLFGDARVLSEAAFREVYGRDIDAVAQTLLSEDLVGFEADVRAVGIDLAERGVSFGEVVASLHLFEESTAKYFGQLSSDTRAPLEIFLIFDKLSHCRIMLLAEAYFTDREAVLGARLRGLESEAEALAGGPTGRASFHGLVGKSSTMRQVYERIAAVSGGDGTVLIVGESGTGKELVARALHEARPVPDRPFVVVNCAALPRELIESELFGYRKGAYTGAQGEYIGLIRAAAKGTLFFDEITEMPREAQAKLLRVMEERTVRPVGTAHEVPVDVRFIASTNRDPEKAVQAGFLRRDLWYRLNVHTIVLPPLRDRLEDVPLLVEHFTELFARRGLRRVEGIDAGVLSALCAYSWPGNVRELRNSLEHALTIGQGTQLSGASFPSHIVDAISEPSASSPPPPPPTHSVPTLDEAERALILRALAVTEGNKAQAARLLQISRHRLYDRLRKFGLTA